ncbi:signal transduction histidine kinase [Actinoalloteichus hoggarensis]|uniref:sensor histidine kinase n=1 Tax=Actinoalloteichus hoggarensis TaxID=1470176 RepID=UPI00183954D2|nr:sensor histidine kinase [Actinoalloteichus hoggarensis]MBB5920303.1 signal transduction histidine kinase [Actinoalloteichus hoggarensis]
MINRREVRDFWRTVDVSIRDLPAALLILSCSFVPAFHHHGTQLGGMPDRPFDAPAVVAIALQCLPLAVRRRWPAWCLGLASAGFAVDQLGGYHTLGGTAFAIAVLSAGAHLEHRRRLAALLFSAAYVPLAIVLSQLGTGETVVGFVTFYLAVAFVWGIGAWLRSMRAMEAERRRLVAEETRNAERARLARELHDVVTHHVTAMVVQAEAARYLTAAPDRLDETLTTVTDTGRRAITELRHLLDVLNPDHGSSAETPAVGRVRALVEQTRRAGQPVEFSEQGTPPVSAGGADLVAYRVVQEALTNALKHDHGSRISVGLRHGEGEITVEVGTDGSGGSAANPGGSGRGLAGLRDRVDALGGDFSAEPQSDGGFRVLARIPFERAT